MTSGIHNHMTKTFDGINFRRHGTESQCSSSMLRAERNWHVRQQCETLRYNVQNAKKVAQGVKNQHQRQQRREGFKPAKNKREVVEKHLSQAEKDMFYQAKVKELRV